MKFFISYDYYKTFSINFDCLNIAGIYPKQFILTWKKYFSRIKGLKSVTDKVPKKCTKKGTKTFFHFTDSNIYKNSILLFHCYWLSAKFKDFLIISNVSQIFHVFVLLYKDKLKVQHESATCLLCTNMLYFYVALFLGRS